MSDIQAFSPYLLNNFCNDPTKGLSGFMSGQQAFKEIEAVSKSTRGKTISELPYFGGMKAIWITIKTPFEMILSIFYHSIALLARCLLLSKVSRIFTVLGQHATRDWEQLCDQWRFNQPLLTPAYNVHKASSWDIFGYGVIPLEDIRDEKVVPMTFKSSEFRAGVKDAMYGFYHYLEKSRTDQGWIHWIYTLGKTVSKQEKNRTILTFTNKYRENPATAFDWLKEQYRFDKLQKPIQHLYTKLKANDATVAQIKDLSLFSDRGLCRGASLWFIYLLFKTEHLFESHQAHIKAVAEQFRTGIPKEATLLQALHESDDLLHLEKKDLLEHKVSLYELDHDHQSAEHKINSLPMGIYRVGAYCHSMVYLKIDDSESYVWNPECGLYPMNGKEMLNMILRYHYKQGDPASHIYFHKFASTEPAVAVG